MSMWVCACAGFCLCECRYQRRQQEKLSIPGYGDTGLCEFPMWLLGTELESSARASRALLNYEYHIFGLVYLAVRDSKYSYLIHCLCLPELKKKKECTPELSNGLRKEKWGRIKCKHWIHTTHTQPAGLSTQKSVTSPQFYLILVLEQPEGVTVYTLGQGSSLPRGSAPYGIFSSLPSFPPLFRVQTEDR